MISKYIQNMGTSTTIAVAIAAISLIGFKMEYEKTPPSNSSIIENLFIAAFIVCIAYIIGSMAGLVATIIKEFIGSRL